MNVLILVILYFDINLIYDQIEIKYNRKVVNNEEQMNISRVN